MLVHETTVPFLKKIVEETKILPAKMFDKRFKTARYNNVYLGVLFKHMSMFPEDICKVAGKQYFDDKVFLLFDKDLLKSQAPECWSPSWRFGDCTKKDSIRYKQAMTPDENIKLWETQMKAQTSKGTFVKSSKTLYLPKQQFGQNELVFAKPLDFSHLLGIFCMDKDIVIPEPIVRLSTLEELTTFLKKHGYKHSPSNKTRRNRT
jgi:hypothetical protein